MRTGILHDEVLHQRAAGRQLQDVDGHGRTAQGVEAVAHDFEEEVRRTKGLHGTAGIDDERRGPVVFVQPPADTMTQSQPESESVKATLVRVKLVVVAPARLPPLLRLRRHSSAIDRSGRPGPRPAEKLTVVPAATIWELGLPVIAGQTGRRCNGAKAMPFKVAVGGQV